MASTGTGVALGSHSLKVVQARKKGGVIKLTRVSNIKLDAATADRAFDGAKTEHLSKLLSGSASGGGEAMLGLTGRDLIVRYTHVPPVPDWRLEMLMKFEIEEVSEQSGGEVSADWARLVLPESVSADNTVLVALAKNASLDPRIKVLKSAGLKLRGACPNAVALHHAFVTTARYDPGEVTLLMHVGAENTDIAIQQDGNLLFARNVSGGGGLFTEAVMQQFQTNYDRAEKMKLQKADVTPKSSARYPDSLAEKVSNAVLGVTGQFVSMVHSSVMFCKAQAKLKELSVDRVVIAGGGANLKGFREYLETNLGIPVVVFDPSAAVDSSGLPPEQQALFDEDPSGLTVPLGLATLMLEKPSLSLEILPEEYRKRRKFMESEVWMIGAGALVALLIAILFFTSSRDQKEARAEAKLLGKEAESQNESINNLASAQAGWELQNRKWVALRDQLRLGPTVRRALGMLTRVIREQEFNEIHLTKVSTDVDKVGGVTYVDVIVKAEINVLNRGKGRVYTDFIAALRDEADAAGGVTLETGTESGNDSGGVFEITLTFAPDGETPSEEG